MKLTKIFTYITIFSMCSCSNAYNVAYDNNKHLCLKNIKKFQDIDSQITYYWENPVLSFAQCPRYFWDFRFKTPDAGRPYYDFVNQFPQKNTVTFFAKITISSVDNERVSVSKISIDHASVKIR